MVDRRWSLVAALVGTAVLLASLRWDVLVESGLAVAVDWLGAFSVVPFGTYYAGVGTSYVVAGAVLAWWQYRGGSGFRRRAVAIGALLPVVWAAVVVHWWNATGDVGIRSVSFALGTSPVLLGLLLGSTEPEATRRAIWAVGGVLVVPFVGGLLAGSVTGGGLRTLEGTVTLVSALLLVALDAAWGYPLYRLGESVEPAR